METSTWSGMKMTIQTQSIEDIAYIASKQYSLAESLKKKGVYNQAFEFF